MTLSLYAVAIWASTLFNNTPFDSVTPKKEITKNKSTVALATGWESVPNWSAQAEAGTVSTTYTRATPQLNDAVLKMGAIVVFAKGYDFEGFNKSAEKPLGLPFYMMTLKEDFEKPFAWFSENSVGNIKVGLQMAENMQSEFQKNSNKIQFRYFVLTKDFLQQNNLTPKTAQQLSYSRLVQMLGVTP